MNLVRAISLGGGGRDLRGGNDSTQLICHVQLLIIALDCIFNIVVDNFLRDPLTVLIIFICQVFLLIIGLIFYLMASANQAMKEGMHEKVMRYHQLTTVLWTLYFSMLIWWYIWVLKRSWPSAGDHFSFTFSGSAEHDLRNNNSSRSTTTYSPQMTTTSTTTTEIPLTLSPTGEGEWTTIFPSISANQSNTNRTQSMSSGVTEKPENNTISLFFPFRFFSIMNKTKGLVPLSPPISGHLIAEDFTFFWTPGFIAVYTIERSVSLFFYVAFILGTLHIVNTSLNVEDETTHGAKNKMNDGRNTNSKQTVRQRIRSSLYGSSKNPITSPTNSHKSEFMDEDNGDSFIRHLEYDGDPFENSQYEYQYKNNNYQPPITSFNYGSHYHPNAAAPYGDLSNDHPIMSDGDEENGSDKSSETETNRKRRNGRKRESRNHPSDLKKNSKTLFSSSLNYPSFTSQFKPSKNKDKQIEKTKGGLRNMMMMAELETTTTAQNQESFSEPTNNDHDRKSASIVSTSIDSIAASGSTDKLLTSGSSKNDKLYQSQNEAFHT